MTSKIDAAIAKVTSGVKRLGRGDRNAHGGYNFASIDNFLEMTGSLCGDAGLNVIMDETDFEVIPEFFTTSKGKTAGLRIKFAIYLRADGESAGPFHRSIMVPANMGSQAFGAGQSYVLKQFLRATFQIPTGDKGEDIDAHDTGTMRGAANDSGAKIDDGQFAQLTTLAEHSGADLRGFCTYFKVDAVKDLPASHFTKAKAMLERKLAEKEKEAA